VFTSESERAAAPAPLKTPLLKVAAYAGISGSICPESLAGIESDYPFHVWLNIFNKK